MRSLMPWMGAPSLKREVDRLFERFLEPDWSGFPAATGEWVPSLDLSETKEALTVKVEIPGMDSKDVQVTLQENVLTVKGEKREEKESKDERYHRVERTYGAFARSVRLPVAVDGSKVEAKFKNGVLTVMLPKTPGARGTTVPVKAE